jgi:hypothetical protein
MQLDSVLYCELDALCLVLLVLSSFWQKFYGLRTARIMANTFSKIEYVSFDFAKANKRFAENKFLTPDLVVGDRSRTGIVCCSGPRCTPEVFFKLRFQEAFCVRNEGGRTADLSVLQTILLIDILGSTVNEKIEEIMVVHYIGE